jgi:hypothetical protein
MRLYKSGFLDIIIWVSILYLAEVLSLIFRFFCVYFFRIIIKYYRSNIIFPIGLPIVLYLIYYYVIVLVLLNDILIIYTVLLKINIIRYIKQLERQ